MDSSVKKAIDDKYNSIVDSYEITDATILSRLNDWYEKMKAFGESARDAADFEAKFASSELIGEYSDIFLQITQKCRLRDVDCGSISDEEEEQWIQDEKNGFLGSIPIIGNVLKTKSKIDFFKKRNK